MHLKGALEMESLSLCGSSEKGAWREGSLAGDPEGYLEKALETGISFHRGSIWGTWRARLPGTTESWVKGLWGLRASLSQEAPWRGASGRAALLGNPKDEVFERYAKCPLSGLPLYSGPFGEPGGGLFTVTFERSE
jgi:hypothetical protein